ncbi:MAG: hypothetical protein AAFU41_15210 [Pseudomonadota bacterium]
MGGVIGMGVTAGKVWEDGTKAITTIVAAALSGSLGIFLQFVDDLGDAVFAYPMGLVLGFIWPFVRGSWGILKNKEQGNRVYALAHVVTLVVVSLLVFALTMSPYARSLIEPSV